MNLESNKHFKEAKTREEIKLFDEEWKKICDEKGVSFIPYHSNSQRFFIIDKDLIVGTIEITKRNPSEFSICEPYYEFEKDERVSKDYNHVFEVGKIGIKKEYRNKGYVKKFMYLLYFYSQKNDVKQFIGYMNMEFYRLLLKIYGVKLELLSPETKTKTHTSAPILVEVEKTKQVMLKKKLIEPISLQKS